LEREPRVNESQVNRHPPEAKMGVKDSSQQHIAATDSVTLQLETQYKNVVLNIKSLNSEKEVLKKAIAEYEQWVSVAPDREAEWSSLTREYGQLKKHYDYLFSQNLEAKSMLNLEKRQKGSQFKIVDTARYPEKPIKPDFFKIIGLAVIIGLGLGGGLTLVLDFFDGTLRDPETVESTLGIPLIATIPKIETLTEQKKQKLRHYFSIIILVVGNGLVIASFVVVWSKGYIVI
jgi:capsular polysaccharide biosynthesis protein